MELTKNLPKEISKMIEKTREGNTEVRQKAIKDLVHYFEWENRDILGKVVMALLDLCEDEKLRNEAGDGLYELSRKWNLGSSIPTELRKHVTKQIFGLDNKGWLNHMFWVTVIKTSDNWAFKKAEPLLPRLQKPHFHSAQGWSLSQPHSRQKSEESPYSLTVCQPPT